MKQFYLNSLLLCLFTMMGAKASAHDITDDTDGIIIYYNWINNNTELEVTYCGSTYYWYDDEYSGNVVIPASVTYNGKTYSVTSIGNYAFYSCSGLTSVNIPNSVTTIGESVFYNCI